MIDALFPDLWTVLRWYGLPAGAIGAVVLAASFTPIGQAALTFLVNTRLGRGLIIAGGVIGFLALTVMRAFSAGRAQGSAAVDHANAAAVAERQAINRQTTAESDDALRDELRHYERPSRVLPLLAIGLLTTSAQAIVVAAALAMAACTTTGGRGGAFCDVEQPIRLSETSIVAMDHDELAAAVAHNRHGERECGWRP